MTEKKSKETKSQPSRRVFSVEFKAGAVKLATRPGMSVAQAARDLGISDTLLRAWIDKARAELGSAAISGDERSELAQLRREVRILKEEREILKKAAAFFAKESRS